MKFLRFETGGASALAVPLRELQERYLAKNPPGNSSDRINIIKAFDLLHELFPDANTVSFSVDHLLIFRNNLAERISEKTGKTYSIDYCNKLLGFVRAAFYWGMSPNLKAKSFAEITPPLVSDTPGFTLSKIPLLKAGEGRQNPKRIDVPIEHVEAVLNHLPELIADMLRLLLLTAMRPDEVCKMRVGDIKKKWRSSASTTGSTATIFGSTSCGTTKLKSISETSRFRSASKLRKSWKSTSTASLERPTFSQRRANADSGSRLPSRN